MGRLDVITILKQFAFIGVMLFLFLPLLQQFSNSIEERQLEGAFSPKPDVEFASELWWSGEYQSTKTDFLNENFGFRSTLVRLYNQIGFSIFSESRANDVVVGKEDVLFLDYYIAAHYGSDFLGEEILGDKVGKLKVVKDSLTNHGVKLMVLLAPGKGSFYPEFIPKNWTDSLKGTTNYAVFSRQLRDAKIPLFDAKAWFENAKDTSRYLLYPKTGIHWSKYGEYLVLDSMINRVSNDLNMALPKLVMDSVSTGTIVRDTDDDIERTMNLLFDIPDWQMAYPFFHFDEASAMQKPNVLTIGDSYYWGQYYYGLSAKVYDNSEFWYYSETIYPNSVRESNKVKDLNLKKELESTDMIILWLTESNVYSFGFIENAYEAYTNPSKLDDKKERLERISYYTNQIVNTPDWYAKVVAQAKSQGISIEKAVQNNAEYMVWQEKQK